MKRFSPSGGDFHIFVFYLWLIMQIRRVGGRGEENS